MFCFIFKKTAKIALRDLKLAETEKFGLGMKIVRGAYLDEVRANYTSRGNTVNKWVKKMDQKKNKNEQKKTDELVIEQAIEWIEDGSYIFTKMPNVKCELQNKMIFSR